MSSDDVAVEEQYAKLPPAQDASAEGPDIELVGANVKFSVKLVGNAARVAARNAAVVDGKPLPKKTVPRKNILKGVDVEVKPGRLLGILGPSGSGKTTLLNVLGGITVPTGDSVTALNGKKASPQQLEKIGAYVEQDDCLLATATVRETLHLAALLQLPDEKYTWDEKREVAEEVIRSMRLGRAADTKVGSPADGIIGVSGGERKRTAIGIALVRSPLLLLLDEPTSGLDASSAYIVVNELATLARQAPRRAVVATIHQPPSDVFNLFDDLLILADGRTIYHGPRADVVDYFSQLGYQCPTYSNPADFIFMRVLEPVGDAEDAPQGDAETAVVAVESGANQKEALATQWKASAQATELRGRCQAVADRNDRKKSMRVGEASIDLPKNFKNLESGGGASNFTQLRLLLVRAAQSVIRNKMRMQAMIGQTTIFAVIIALVYPQIGTEGSGAAQDRNGVLFFVAANSLMAGLMGTLTTFANERSAFIRERRGGLYNLTPYFVAKFTVELPVAILSATIYIAIIYWAVGLQNDLKRFFIAVALSIAMTINANALGVCVGSLFKSIEVAMAVVPLFVLPLMLFSGFFVNSDNLPVYFKWVEKVSPIRYGFVGYARNEYEGLTFECPDGVTFGHPTCIYRTGEDVLEALAVPDDLSVLICLAVLYGMAGAFLLLAYGFLYRLGSARKKST